MKPAGAASPLSFSHGQARTLAIIPARGGSKGLPGKNIQPLGGIPLIGYSIDVALRARNISRVVVSTDDEAIAGVSREFGAEVPFLRPGGLAGDRSRLEQVKAHALEHLERHEGYVPDVVVMLLPTHPFRTLELVEFLVDKNLEGFSPVMTVRVLKHSDLTLFHPDVDGGARPCLRQGSKAFPGCARNYARSYGVYDGANRLCSDNPYIHALRDPASVIDIDFEHDLRLAEKVLERGLFKPPWAEDARCSRSSLCA